MEDNIVEVWIMMMCMLVPAGSLNMYLNIPDPYRITDPDPCLYKIRALVVVKPAWLEDTEHFATTKFELVGIKMLELPDVLEETFGHNNLKF